MVSKDLFNLLESYAVECGITYDEIIEVLKKSLAASAKKVEPNATIIVKVNPEKHEVVITAQRQVVEELSIEPSDDPNAIAEITLEDAKKIKPNCHVGDIISKNISTKDDFGRQAARSAKSTFASNIKALLRDKAFQYFKSQENEMISAQVVKIDDNYAYLNIGRGTTAVLPKAEWLPNDSFNVGDKISVYIKKVEQTTKDPKVKLSRLDRNLITRLLETYIPEIKEGIIEIKGIARDAGDRSKIAIYSTDPRVDALGSCVGENGARIKEVVQALNGEKIDLYKWSEDPEELIRNSLQPAKVTLVLNIDPKEKTSLAIVPDDQLSLAIGKAGQNVRLAVQSCGWKIDIKSASEARNEGLLEI